jgi:hypothetical protein
MIGMEETKKIVMGRVMSDLMKKVDQAGFETRDFFFHSTCVGYMAQILAINLEAPTPAEREILESLRLPNYASAALKQNRLWDRFEEARGFDAFTAGILHDTGKVLNTVCYEGIFPLVLHEYERSQWKGSLLQSEVAVVGDFQHPATGGALLERWEVFPDLVEPIRGHHRIGGESRVESILIALSNCLSKGFSPFPRAIAIPDEYRKQHLDPVADPDGLDNPLLSRYQALTDAFEAAKGDLDLSPDEVDSGEYEPEHVEALLAAAREAVTGSAAVTEYRDALVDQNPEFMNLVEWSNAPVEDLLALGLILQESITSMVNGLFQGARTTT